MEKKTICFKNGNLIDGIHRTALPNTTVIVADGRIEAIDTTGCIPLPEGGEVVDLADKTIMPGLIDAHVHLLGIQSMNPLTWITDHPTLRAIRSVPNLVELLRSGYTTVRDCGSPNAIFLRNAVEEGSIPGPRIVTCGAIITQTAGHGDLAHFLPIEWIKERGIGRIADGVGECRKAAREQLRLGANFIKMCTTGGVMSEKDQATSSQFSMEEIKAIVEEAHSADVKAASHAQGTQGIKNALAAGVDTIEHGFYIDDEIIDTMLAQQSFLVPCLSIVEAIVNKGKEAGVPEVSLSKARQAQEAHLRSFEKACHAQIPIACGCDYLSDPMGPMGKNAIELELQVKAGRPPMDVLISATRINAMALGLDRQIGTIEKGKRADILIVDGDPSQDIAILQDRRRIALVLQDGQDVLACLPEVRI